MKEIEIATSLTLLATTPFFVFARSRRGRSNLPGAVIASEGILCPSVAISTLTSVHISRRLLFKEVVQYESIVAKN
ncbi:MAG: hypothetical protein J7J57_05965 [Caldisericaceae bacterium]|nr:hypothetical protein [Caldisericaceae bacterium]